MVGGRVQALPPRPVLLAPIAINAVARSHQPQSDAVAHSIGPLMSQSIDSLHGALDRRSPSPQPGQLAGPFPSGTPAPGLPPSNPTDRPLDPRVKPRVPAAVPRPVAIPGPEGTALANGHAARLPAMQQLPSQLSSVPADISGPAPSPGPATAQVQENDVRQPGTSQHAPAPGAMRPADAASAVQHNSVAHATMPAHGPLDPRRAPTLGHAAMPHIPLTSQNPTPQGSRGEGPGLAQSRLPKGSVGSQQATNAAHVPDASGWIRPPSPLRSTLLANQLSALTNQQAAVPLGLSHHHHPPGPVQPPHAGAQLEARSLDQGRSPGNTLEAGEIKVEGLMGPRSQGSLQDGWIRPPFHSRPMPPWPSGPGKGSPQQMSGQSLVPDQPQGLQQQQHLHRPPPVRQQAQSEQQNPWMQPAVHYQGQQHVVHPQQISTGSAAGSAVHLGQSQASSSQQVPGQQHDGVQQQERHVRPKKLPAPIPRPALHGPGRP